MRERDPVRLLDQTRGREGRRARPRRSPARSRPAARGRLGERRRRHEHERLRQLAGAVGQRVQPLDAPCRRAHRRPARAASAAAESSRRRRARGPRQPAPGRTAGCRRWRRRRRRQKASVALGSSSRANEFGHRGRAERLELQALRQVMRGQPADQLALRPLLARPRGGHDRHRQLVDSLDQIEQEAQRGHVAPMGVVDRDQDRAALGQVGGQPVQPVQPREVALVGLAGLLEQRPGQRRRPAKASSVCRGRPGARTSGARRRTRTPTRTA